MLGMGQASIYEGDPSQSNQDNMRRVDVMAHERYLGDCCDVLDNIAENQFTARKRGRDPEDQYAIPPYGSNCMFGYDGPTAAWLMPHPHGPALISRHDDADLDVYIAMWVEYWLYNQTRITWAKSSRINEAFEVPPLIEKSAITRHS